MSNKTKKYVAIVTAMLLVLTAVAVNWKYSLLNKLFDPSPESPSGEISSPVNAGVQDTYFDNARYSRTQSRQEALSILNSIINDETVDESTRKNAYEEVTAYAKITEGESSLESVLKAKGFQDCIVFLTKDTATVVVSAESLSEQQSAQIFDAVIAQTGFGGGSVRIVTYP